MELHRHLTRLVRYNGWANRRILGEAAKILPEQPVYLDRYGRLPDELLHILQGQEHWLAVWHGEPARVTVDPTRTALIEAFGRTQAELEGFMAGLTEDDLARTITRKGSDHQVSAPLGDFIGHLVGHGTYHRGGIALLLTNEGASPGDIDFYDFLIADA
jgi:uncharacterized damage-inducible protein DinB